MSIFAFLCLPLLKNWLEKMDYPIITVGRQIGSGGLVIAQRLSERLGIEMYDKQLLTIAAKESGLDESIFHRSDETETFSFFQKALNSLFASNNDYLGNENLFAIQSQAIRELASKHSCVFVGRCADYILRDHSKLLRLFFSAAIEDRVKNISEKFSINATDAMKLIDKTDKNRSAYYNFYTNKSWGQAKSYDLCINTSLLGVEQTADLVLEILKHRFL